MPLLLARLLLKKRSCERKGAQTGGGRRNRFPKRLKRGEGRNGGGETEEEEGGSGGSASASTLGRKEERESDEVEWNSTTLNRGNENFIFKIDCAVPLYYGSD